MHPFTVGIAGLASTGVAVYGTTNSSLPIRWGTSNYAGYFDGNVNVIGTLTATTVTQTSDSRFKENVTDIESTSAQYQLLRLRPVSYTFRQDSTCRSQIDKNDNRTHYGLIAQELQQIFPELVYEDGDGYLSVNYTELIPLILKQIQELSAEVSDLKAKVNQSQTRQTSKKANSDSFVDQAILYQNNPNPFSVDTKIGYQLPQNTQTATLYVYNMNGLQVAEYPITSYGVGSVVVNGGYLEAGMYLYSLIADGQVVDTKRMILLK